MEIQIFEELHQLLNNEKFEAARKLIFENLKTPSEEIGQNLFFQIKLFGFLIDLGCESQNEEDLFYAINFFEKNEKALLTCISKSSYYYNFANAKHGLGKIFYVNNRGVHSINIIKEKFQEPIKLYWLAYKNIDNTDRGLLQKILINLSNSLVTANRIVEGLQFLDIVLRVNSNFPQALISKANALDYISNYTNCAPTISLYAKIYKYYDDGIKTNTLPPASLDRSIQQRQEALDKIQQHQFDINKVENEIHESEKEFNNHSAFRKYCITNFLTLNEHSIYCNCIASKIDNLQIGVRHGIFKTEIVAKLELLLNRIKSEFAFARWLFYQSQQKDTSLEFDTKFSELLDDEIINSQTEMKRSSFRLCYGILDKIALGICKLYNLDSKFIHFETFWNEHNRNVELNKIRNLHLNALYSIACDLNTKTGELKEFKNWRNKLEHNLLVLKNTSTDNLDILNLFEDEEFVVVVDVLEFKNKTLHLMQLTRAAIFSFVFCVRLETIHQNNQNEKNTFTIEFKKDLK